MENITVIGGGLMGSAAAWQLSKKGASVLLIEQQDAIYEYGSSFGERRISRSLGPKDDIFSYLHNTSVAATQELIDFLNSTDAEVHKMTDIYTTSPVTYIYDQNLQAEVNQLLDGQTDQCECASGKEALTKFGMTIPDSNIVIREFKKHSGTLHPAVLISKLHTGIRKQGNIIHYNRKVTNIIRKNSHYEIEITDTKTGESTSFLTEKVVIAGGAYTGELVKNIAPDVKQLISPKRVFSTFFKINKKTYSNYTPEQKKRIIDFQPIFNLTGEQFYGLIEKIDSNGLPVFKTGGHRLYNDIADLNTVWKIAPNKEEIEWSKNSLFDYLSMTNLPLEKENLEFFSGHSCVYSLTKNSVPLVSHVLKNDNSIDTRLVVIGGMSGIGAKGSMCYGLIAANLLLDTDDPAPMYQKTKQALSINNPLNS